jgi:hypothetical protein
VRGDGLGVEAGGAQNARALAGFHLGAEQRSMPAMVRSSCLGIDTHAHQHDHRAGLIGDGGKRLGRVPVLPIVASALRTSVISTRVREEGAIGGIGRGAHDADHGGRERGDRAGAIGKEIGLDAVHGAAPDQAARRVRGMVRRVRAVAVLPARVP